MFRMLTFNLRGWHLIVWYQSGTLEMCKTVHPEGDDHRKSFDKQKI